MQTSSAQQSVINEKENLEHMVRELNRFIAYDIDFDTLPPDEQERLKLQNDIMWQYFEVLEARIAAFPT